jgi:hypothetical protein
MQSRFFPRIRSRLTCRIPADLVRPGMQIAAMTERSLLSLRSNLPPVRHVRIEPTPNASNASPGSARPSERRVRRFIGDDGREWMVEETPLPGYDRRSGTCLVFRSANAARRVRTFPADWFTRLDADLYQLSLHD